MEWFVKLGATWLTALQWLVALAAGFSLLTRFQPCNPGRSWWNSGRAIGTDVAYWFLAPVFLGSCRTLLLAAGIALVYAGRDPEIAFVRQAPLWQQCLAILLIQDLLMYWLHRAFHSRAAWKFHAAHHSSTVVDWISMVRFHPVNLLEFAVVDCVVILLGFSPEAIILLTPFSFVYSAMVHANLNWTFGPLRFLLASPVFHRWHHSTAEEAIDTNFAPTFPFLDLAFGTYYLPVGKLPEEFGIGDPDYPEDFWGQVMHPFQPSAASAQQAAANLNGNMSPLSSNEEGLIDPSRDAMKELSAHRTEIEPDVLLELTACHAGRHVEETAPH